MATDKAITYDNPVVQGGVDNYLGKQPQVQAPRKWQSSPDKPATELAYITEAEKDLILKANIHGGLEGGPNMGPSGIMSLDSFGDVGGGGASGGDTSAGGGAMEGRGFSGRSVAEMNDKRDTSFQNRIANEKAALQIAERAQAKRLSKLTGRRVKETANIANRTYGPLQKYTGERGFFGNLFRGANRYGYTDTYTDGPNEGEVKPGYGGRILGGILGLLTGVPGVGSIIGNQIDKYKPKPKNMTEFNKLGLGGVNPATLDFDPNAQINQNVDTTGYSRFSDKSLGLQTPNYQTGSVSFDPSLGNNAASKNTQPQENTSSLNLNDLSTAFTTNMGQSRMTPEMKQFYTEQKMKQNPSLYDELNPVDIAPSYELRNDGSFRPYEYNYNPESKKGIMQTISDAFFSPAAAAEIDFSQLQQANNKFTPEFSSMEMNNPGVKNYAGTTQQDFINAVQDGKFGVSGSTAFDRNKNQLFSGVNLNKSFSPFNVEPNLIGTNDGTFRQSIDIDRDALETDALNALPKNFFPGYREGGLASMFTRRR